MWCAAFVVGEKGDGAVSSALGSGIASLDAVAQNGSNAIFNSLSNVFEKRCGCGTNLTELHIGKVKMDRDRWLSRRTITMLQQGGDALISEHEWDT
ncbi:hypothetical protein SAMN05421543_11382 [Alicyclobacillus macrosporangiidus]|uniref:Uncharacterized protein n=2 Tax=Alicyclobacillus macrosporangiidus TaxID=392015 RepID=A0A1I7K403_9BACL|nr:hypothetical protein SAMN05421543_11382 [Alicyclobacillus macrosporangiidus]